MFSINIIRQMLSVLNLESYKLVILDRVDSTNNYALDNLADMGEKALIVTEMQTDGRGRNGKKWFSRPGVDITLSFVHRFEADLAHEFLPLTSAVAINRLFKQYRVATKIKWPNDIWLDNETKVAGILQESKIVDGSRYVITGIGLDNIHNWDRNDIVSSLTNHIEHVFSEYALFSFAVLRQEWLDNCFHKGRLISLYQAGELLDSGIHVDLTQDGKIIVQDIITHEIRAYSGSKISLIVENEIE
jgi:biotin-(acetyl-CoA carboxylase) ligase